VIILLGATPDIRGQHRLEDLRSGRVAYLGQQLFQPLKSELLVLGIGCASQKLLRR
jgi:hypothetical protein